MADPSSVGTRSMSIREKALVALMAAAVVFGAYVYFLSGTDTAAPPEVLRLMHTANICLPAVER